MAFHNFDPYHSHLTSLYFLLSLYLSYSMLLIFLNTPFFLTIECLYHYYYLLLDSFSPEFLTYIGTYFFLAIKHAHQLKFSSNMMISIFYWFLSAKQVSSLSIMLENFLHNSVAFFLLDCIYLFMPFFFY